MTAVTCDVCGLPDLYDGTGDGIGSCGCPRCDGGEAAHTSVLCTCPPDDGYPDYGYDGHSPGDEYNIWPPDRPCYGDTFAY